MCTIHIDKPIIYTDVDLIVLAIIGKGYHSDGKQPTLLLC